MYSACTNKVAEVLLPQKLACHCHSSLTISVWFFITMGLFAYPININTFLQMRPLMPALISWQVSEQYYTMRHWGRISTSIGIARNWTNHWFPTDFVGLTTSLSLSLVLNATGAFSVPRTFPPLVFAEVNMLFLWTTLCTTPNRIVCGSIALSCMYPQILRIFLQAKLPNRKHCYVIVDCIHPLDGWLIFVITPRVV